MITLCSIYVVKSEALDFFSDYVCIFLKFNS